MVIAQEPTQPLATLHRPLGVELGGAGEQQHIVLPLVIALGMIMLDVFADRAP
jgi:hypothetical protein